MLPPRASTGALVSILMRGDVLEVALYRRHAVWPRLLRLLPQVGLAVVLGSLAMGWIGDRQLKYVLGALVLALQAFSLLHRSRGEPVGLGGLWLAAVLGVLNGMATMMANAAGPIVLVYLLTMQLPKNQLLEILPLR